VLVRADLNVPMQNGEVSDATRIVRFAPTARELADKGARVVILSHFGRPKDGPSPEFSQAPLVKPLAAAIGKPVGFAPDCIGPIAEKGGQDPVKWRDSVARKCAFLQRRREE
jgi:phosphoglycerate kinase